MKSFLFIFSVLALLAVTISLPCIGDSCGRLSRLYSEYDDDDGVFYIPEKSHNSASSHDDDDNNHENPEKEDTLGFQSAPLYEQQYYQQQEQRPNRQRPSNNYGQSVRPKASGQRSYQSNQQPSNPSTPNDENQETQYTPNPGRNYEGNVKSGNQRGDGGRFQNNGAGSNGHYPGSGNKGGGGGHYQNNGAGYNRHYPGSVNQGGGGGNYQNNGGSYDRYPDRQSSCPNCYATDFGNGDYNKNVINIEK